VWKRSSGEGERKVDEKVNERVKKRTLGASRYA